MKYFFLVFIWLLIGYACTTTKEQRDIEGFKPYVMKQWCGECRR